MTSDDQQFLDLLASIPQDMASYGGRIADYIEKHTNSLASEIREAIDSTTWIPESFKPPRSSSSSSFFSGSPRAPPPPQGMYEQTVAFVSKHRTTIAMVVAFAGTTAYLVHRRKKEHARKRRAKKLPNGAKKEIVVLACSTFHDPLTRSLAVDLERRGYVVYVTVSSTEEDSLVQQEGKADLRPLWMDLTSTVANPGSDVHPDLEPIRELLTRSSASPSSSPSSPTPEKSRSSGQTSGASLYNMTLAGIIVFPGCSGYPHGPLSLLHPSDVVDIVNTRLLSPILTIQQFLPFLARQACDPTSPASPVSIVVAYPSIPASLSPPGQVPEAVISSSLAALASTLRQEIRSFLPSLPSASASSSLSSSSFYSSSSASFPANISIAELRLGNFDLGSVYSRIHNRFSFTDHPSPSYSSSPPQPSPPAAATAPTSSSHPSTQGNSSALTHWHSSQRAAAQRSRLGQSSIVKGSSAREFHNAVFDALAPTPTYRAFGLYEWSGGRRSGTNKVVYVGSGARVYDLVGRFVPSGITAWMMGYRARRDGLGFGSGVGIGAGFYSTGSSSQNSRPGSPNTRAAGAGRSGAEADLEAGTASASWSRDEKEGLGGDSAVWEKL